MDHKQSYSAVTPNQSKAQETAEIFIKIWTWLKSGLISDHQEVGSTFVHCSWKHLHRVWFWLEALPADCLLKITETHQVYILQGDHKCILGRGYWVNQQHFIICFMTHWEASVKTEEQEQCTLFSSSTPDTTKDCTKGSSLLFQSVDQFFMFNRINISTVGSPKWLYKWPLVQSFQNTNPSDKPLIFGCMK